MVHVALLSLIWDPKHIEERLSAGHSQIRRKHIEERSPAGHSPIRKNMIHATVRLLDSTRCDEGTEPSSEAVRFHLQIPTGNEHNHSA